MTRRPHLLTGQKRGREGGRGKPGLSLSLAWPPFHFKTCFFPAQGTRRWFVLASSSDYHASMEDAAQEPWRNEAAAAEPSQAISSAFASFPSISVGPSWPRSLQSYVIVPFPQSRGNEGEVRRSDRGCKVGASTDPSIEGPSE